MQMKRTMLLAAGVAAVFALGGCSRYVGYGVVNWSSAELGLSAGDVVPVVIRSNISQLYVIELSGRSSVRAEIPLWQLTLYSSRGAARKAALEGRDYNYIYATSKTDGLPVREAADNTARQVYRLRGAEALKITGRGEGSPVIGRDGEPMPGEWLAVMTSDGTRGWCFSYNLEVFDERDGAPVEIASSSSFLEDDETLRYILGRTWYPAHYATMLSAGAVDLARVNPAWGFFPGRDSRIARIEEEEILASFPYTGISATSGGAYHFDGTSLTVEMRENGTLAVQFTDDLGAPVLRYFAALDATPEEIIQNETERRHAQLARIANAGPRFVSGNYGVFQLSAEGTFLWSGYRLLVPAIIPEGSRGQGRADIRYFLSRQLASSYDGVLTLQFDGQQSALNFLYSLADRGLRLEPVSPSNISENTVLTRDISPIVIFFRADTLMESEPEPPEDYSAYSDDFDYSYYLDDYSEYSQDYDYSDYSELESLDWDF